MRTAFVLKFLIFLIFVSATVTFFIVLEPQKPTQSLVKTSIFNSPMANYTLSGSFNRNYFISPHNLTAFPNLSALSLKCYPALQGLSPENAARILTYTKYYDCKIPDKSKIELIDDKVFINCAEKSINSYSLDPLEQEIFGVGESTVIWERISKPTAVNINKAQYIFIKCARTSIYSMVFNHFDSKISEKSQNLRKNIEAQFNLNSTRPLTVHILVIDSVSRQNFFRTQTDTLKFLNTQVLSGKFSEKFTVYDFWLTNTINLFTKANMIPVLYGETHTEIENEIGKMNTNNDSFSPAYLEIQKKAIWSYFSSLGYVTMFGYDTIWDFLSSCTGKKIQTDYNFLNFWKAAMKIYNYNDFSDKQRCFGGKNAHSYLLDYSLQFIKNYSRHNRFLYAHISPAHESTGVIQTLDGDLKSYLTSILSYFSDNSHEDLVLLLMSDHGRGAARLEFSLEQFTEHRLPITMIITNKEFVQNIGGAKALAVNSERLIGRFDLHLTLQTLAIAPYGRLSQKSYTEMKKKYANKQTVSLFMEEIRKNRTCEDIAVRDIDCLCKNFEKVEKNDIIHYKAVNVLVNLAMESIRKRVKNVFKCKIPDFFQIGEVSVFFIKTIEDGASRIYKANVHSLLMEVEVIANFAKEEQFINTRSWIDNLDDMNPREIFNQTGIEMMVQISSINITRSLCEGFNECLCNTQWTTFHKAEKVTCNVFCKEKSMDCAESTYLLVSICEDPEISQCICY